MPHLTVLVGAPGAGKSTFAKQTGKAVVSTDGYREAGEDVVFDSPAANPAVRRAAVNIARKHGATVEATVIDASLKTCVESQRGRAHPVPYADVARIWHHIHEQTPQLEREGFDNVTFVARRRK